MIIIVLQSSAGTFTFTGLTDVEEGKAGSGQ